MFLTQWHTTLILPPQWPELVWRRHFTISFTRGRGFKLVTFKPGGACDGEGQVLLAYSIYPAHRQEGGISMPNRLPVGCTEDGSGSLGGWWLHISKDVPLGTLFYINLYVKWNKNTNILVLCVYYYYPLKLMMKLQDDIKGVLLGTLSKRETFCCRVLLSS